MVPSHGEGVPSLLYCENRNERDVKYVRNPSPLTQEIN